MNNPYIHQPTILLPLFRSVKWVMKKLFRILSRVTDGFVFPPITIMKVHFGELGKDFILHYFKLFGEAPDNVAPMYAEHAELHCGEQSISGRANIVSALASLGKLTLGNYFAQPYSGDDVLVTAGVKAGSESFVMTFIVALIGEGNHFGVTYHLCHHIPQ
jgi:hypothetical protein